MGIKIGFLGIGAAGANICEVAESLNYRTAIVNTSPEDLEAVKLVKNKLLLGIQGGAGKDRRIAKQEVRSFHREIVNFVEDKFYEKDIDLIYVVFSSGGGTGSGIAPMTIDLLKKLLPHKNFAAMVVLPDLTESVVAQANSQECLKELSTLNVPTIIIDNNKYIEANKDRHVTRQKLYDTVNSQVLADLNVLINTKRPASRYGNIDSQDILKLLLTPGVMMVGITHDLDLTFKEGSLQKQIMKSWEDSPYPQLELDRVISRMGVIYELEEKYTSMINYEELYKEIGTPLELFEGIYEPNTKATQKIISVITGLSFPITRVNNMNEIINKNKELFVVKKDFSIDSGSLDWFAEVRDTASSPVTETSDFDDDLDLSALFSKY